MTEPLPTALTIPVPVGALGLVLPLPPSANRMYRRNPNAVKKDGTPYTAQYKTKTAREYGWHIRAAMPSPPTIPSPPYRLVIRLLVRSVNRMDASNAIKALEDSLFGVLKAITGDATLDDANVAEVTVRKIILPARRGGPVRAEVVLSTIAAEEMPP